MERFQGTLEGFNTFIGPRIRNVIQNLTRRERKSRNGVCEECGNINGHLQSAHVKERDRKIIINDVLSNFLNEKGFVDCSLDEVERLIKKAHYPLATSFRFLCASCHRNYDRPVLFQKSASIALLVRQFGSKHTAYRSSVLPISLEPKDVDLFRARILKHGSANIHVYYHDGRFETRTWTVIRLSGRSNIKGNLRSRSEFRQGNWQRAGIQRIHVEVS